MGGFLAKFFKDEEQLDLFGDEFAKKFNEMNIDNVDNDNEVAHDEIDSDDGADGDHMVCKSKTGVVTDVTPDFFLIDGKYYFPIDESNYDFIVDGITVNYTARKSSKRTEWKVLSVEKFVDQEEGSKQKEQSVVNKVLVGKVKEINGDFIQISPDITCDLKNVIVSYTLIIGDWVNVEIIEEKDSCIENTITVRSIKPVRCFEIVGHITHWDTSTNNGIIDSKIIFSASVCTSHYDPVVGDKVMANVIESFQHTWNLRAVSVTLILAAERESRADYSCIIDNIEELLANKNAVQVKCVQQPVINNLGDVAIYVIQAENGGIIPVYIESVTREDFRSSNLVNVQNLYFPICIQPGADFQFEVKITRRHMGNFRELIVVSFKGDWKIGVLLTVDVNMMESCSNILHSQTKNLSKSRSNYRRLTDDRDKYLRVSGIRVEGRRKFIPRHVPPHNIPKFFMNAITNEGIVEHGKKLKMAVIQCTAVVSEILCYNNYVSKWDACLFLEEVKDMLRLKNLNEPRACFLNRDEFLVLKLPKLLETDIGLCVGDKLYANELYTQKSSAIMSYEGIIHNICHGEIYLKFKESFHTAHGGKDYSIIFEMNRSKYKRSHQAIRDVTETIDPDQQWLFPPTNVANSKKLPVLEIIGELPPPELDERDDDDDNRVWRSINNNNRKNDFYSKYCSECRSEIIPDEQQVTTANEGIVENQSIGISSQSDAILNERISENVAEDDDDDEETNDECVLQHRPSIENDVDDGKMKTFNEQSFRREASSYAKNHAKIEEHADNGGERTIMNIFNQESSRRRQASYANNRTTNNNRNNVRGGEFYGRNAKRGSDNNRTRGGGGGGNSSSGASTGRAVVNRRQILKWFNKSLNRYQKDAVKNVLRGEGRPFPYIIFGPPGTGKTITLVELILQLWSILPESRILVCAPSNSAVNVICERLLQYNLLKPGEIIRLLSYNYAKDHTLPDSLRNFYAVPTYDIEDSRSINKNGVNFIEQQAIGRHRITLSTCFGAGILTSMQFPDDHFTHVICDEACQPREPEIMIPISLLNMQNDRSQIVLAGDPKQLGPISIDDALKEFGFDISFTSRLLDCGPYLRHPKYEKTYGFDPRYVTMLIKNYRSSPEILNLYNSIFYGSVLEPVLCSMHGEYRQFIWSLKNHLPQRDDESLPSVIFHGVEGAAIVDESGSSLNVQEIVQVIYYLSKFFKCGINKDDVGIITPYRAQTKKLISMLTAYLDDVPKVASVEEFQGQEKKLIILSTVKATNKNFPDIPNKSSNILGFLDNPKRINVAVSRARYLLLIIGDPHALATDTKWRCVIDYCINNNSYVGCEFKF